jgi:hypothetical protein
VYGKRGAVPLALSKTQEAFLTKIRTVGGGELGVALDDDACSYLVAVIAKDLGLTKRFPELPKTIPPFFGKDHPAKLRAGKLNFRALFEKLLSLRQDADTYFYCLANLHKARLKYARILEAQPLPTVDQVGPRGLLQYGSLSPKALAGFLYWRKWIFDIDNRAAQETGYLFEPIIAHAIGGIAVSASKSPIRRIRNKAEGRQVDCVRESDRRAYEIKLRVTIAASGQGRWQEELTFPSDCRASRFTPVLIVLDPTPNPKLTELRRAFLEAKGEVYIGSDAWKHLEVTAGETMSTFIQKYVREPIQSLLKESPENLPDMHLALKEGRLLIGVGRELLEIKRAPTADLDSGVDSLPDDVDNHFPSS